MDDMLSSILNDPEKLQSAISMASSMLGGGAPAAEEAPPGRCACRVRGRAWAAHCPGGRPAARFTILRPS